MKFFRTCLLALVGVIAVDGALFVEPAAAQPAFFFNTHKTRLPFNSCLRDAKRTVEALGLANRSSSAFGSGGTAPTVNAFILCTKIPGGGPCRGQDGAVVTFISTSFPGPDAKAMLDRMVATFGDAVLFDCN